MSVRRLVSAALGLSIVLAAASLRAEEPVLLRYKFHKGDELIYRAASEFKQMQTIMGQEMESTMSQQAVVVRSVDEVDSEGAATLKTKAERRKAKADFAQVGEFEFDSKATERDTSSQVGSMLTPLMERLTGSEYQVVVAPRGNVKQVKGYSELVADLVKDNPFAAQFGGAGDNAAAAISEQDSFVLFGDQPVRPGESWEAPFDVEMKGVGRMRGKETYRYEGADKVGSRKTAKLSMKTDLTVDINIDMGQSQVSGTMTASNASGTIQFDPEAGRLVSFKKDLTLTGQLSVAFGGMMLTIDTRQEQSNSLELLDKLPE